MPELHFLKVLYSGRIGEFRFNAHFGWAGATEKGRKRLLCTFKNIWVLLCLKAI